MSRGKNGVNLPEIGYEPNEYGSSIIEELNRIEPVSCWVVFDDPKKPLVKLENPNSTGLLELLNKANLRRGTVTRLKIEGKSIPPAALARLNWFLHIHGYSKGFRGWKIEVQKGHEGAVLWKSKHTWIELKRILKF